MNKKYAIGLILFLSSSLCLGLPSFINISNKGMHTASFTIEYLKKEGAKWVKSQTSMVLYIDGGKSSEIEFDLSTKRVQKFLWHFISEKGKSLSDLYCININQSSFVNKRESRGIYITIDDNNFQINPLVGGSAAIIRGDYKNYTCAPYGKLR